MVYFKTRIELMVSVELRPEAAYGKDVVGDLVKCMYCTRDPAQGCEKTYLPCTDRDLVQEMSLQLLRVRSPSR